MTLTIGETDLFLEFDLAIKIRGFFLSYGTEGHKVDLF